MVHRTWKRERRATRRGAERDVYSYGGLEIRRIIKSVTSIHSTKTSVDCSSPAPCACPCRKRGYRTSGPRKPDESHQARNAVAPMSGRANGSLASLRAEVFFVATLHNVIMR